MIAQSFAPKRGRPSAKQVVAIDEAILATARRMFLTDGYDAMAMDAVAAELGISKGTLYVRHASKEALLYAVMKQTIDSWSTDSAKTDYLLPDELAPRLREHLRRMGRKMTGTEVRAYYQLWMSVHHRVPEIAELFHNHGFTKGVDVIAHDLRLDDERSGRKSRDPEGAAALLLSTLTGWYMQESGVRDISAEEMEAVADRAVEFFMMARAAW